MSSGLLEWVNAIRFTMANDPGRELFKDKIYKHGFLFLENYLADIQQGTNQNHLIDLVKTPGRKKFGPLVDGLFTPCQQASSFEFDIVKEDTIDATDAYKMKKAFNVELEAPKPTIDEDNNNTTATFSSHYHQAPRVELQENPIVDVEATDPTATISGYPQKSFNVELGSPKTIVDGHKISTDITFSNHSHRVSSVEFEEKLRVVADTVDATVSVSSHCQKAFDIESLKPTIDGDKIDAADNFSSNSLRVSLSSVDFEAKFTTDTNVMNEIANFTGCPWKASSVEPEEQFTADKDVMDTTATFPNPSQQERGVETLKHNIEMATIDPVIISSSPRKSSVEALKITFEDENLDTTVVSSNHFQLETSSGFEETTRRQSATISQDLFGSLTFTIPGPVPLRKSIRDPTVVASSSQTTTPGTALGGERTSWLKKAREAKALETARKSTVQTISSLPSINKNLKRKSGETDLHVEDLGFGSGERRHKSTKFVKGEAALLKPDPLHFPVAQDHNMLLTHGQHVEYIDSGQEDVLERLKRAVEGLGRVGTGKGKSLSANAVAIAAEARAAAEARVAGRVTKDSERKPSDGNVVSPPQDHDVIMVDDQVLPPAPTSRQPSPLIGRKDKGKVAQSDDFMEQHSEETSSTAPFLSQKAGEVLMVPQEAIATTPPRVRHAPFSCSPIFSRHPVFSKPPLSITPEPPLAPQTEHKEDNLTPFTLAPETGNAGTLSEHTELRPVFVASVLPLSPSLMDNLDEMTHSTTALHQGIIKLLAKPTLEAGIRNIEPHCADLDENKAINIDKNAVIDKPMIEPAKSDIQAFPAASKILSSATKLLNSTLGINKKGKPEVKRVMQKAAVAAKKHQEESEKKALRLKEMENRRQLAVQRKLEEEKIRTQEQERKKKEEFERRKKEREENTGTGKWQLKPSAVKKIASGSSAVPQTIKIKPPKMATNHETVIIKDDLTFSKPFQPIQMPGALNTPMQSAELEPEPIASESIELPDINSEYSDSEDENRPKTFDPPDWAQSPELREALRLQSTIDPDRIFGPVEPLRMEELFKTRTSRFRSRTSSANWTGSDCLTLEEQREYARRMGFR